MKKKVMITVTVFIVILGVFLYNMTNELKVGSEVQLSGINPADVSDGRYEGQYDYSRWSNTVAVVVQEGKIVSIDIINDVVAPEITNCSEEIIHRVIEAQDTNVDAVSGATVTSKAYLKAIEDALK
jgi:uncharacterized protein with FMN-binding domain